MIARLISLDGNPEILVDHPLLLVGRDPRCNARIDSPRVSRLHCYLAAHQDGFTVRDLGSTNGIKVNGHRAGECLLHAGDVLEIANFRYRLIADRPAESTGGPVSDTRYDSGPG